MRTTLTHLPPIKQQELNEITQLIREHANVEMLILFGSYARGDWVEEYADDGIHFQYQSDYDLLAIVETPSTSEQGRLERSIWKAIKQLLTVHTPVSLIVHDAAFINRRLANAQYFFSDIKKDGIFLYDSGKIQLRTPKNLNPRERHQLAKEDFEYWFSKANTMFETFNFDFEKGYYSDAAFLLHQVTERLYSGILLVFTRYKPNTHDLQELRHLVNALDSRFIRVFSLATEEEKQRFELLRSAYVDARYKKHYVVTGAELHWLAQEVQKLQQLAEILCNEKIKGFLADADN